MNTCTISTIQPERNEGKLAISETTAVLAWCDSRDAGARVWLREKYRPLIAHIVAREVRNPAARSFMIDEALREALSTLDVEISTTRVAAFFARIALNLCREDACIVLEDESLLAA